MRLIGIILALACASGSAFAQTAPKPAAKPAPKPAAAAAKPATPKPAPAASARGGYAVMTAGERMAIQSDLIWTGDYNGMIAADMGERAIAAVKTFQKRWGGKDTGALSDADRQKLAQEAKPKQDAAGWRLIDDHATGAWLGLPTKVVPRAVNVGGGSRWQSAHGEVQIDTFRIAASGTTLNAVFDKLKKEPATRKVEYSVLKGDAAVLSGLQGLKKFYVRAQFKDNEVRGVTILYDQALEGTMDAITVAMSNAFVAFPDGIVTGLLPPGPPPKRKVDYGTGIVVSTTGHILTDLAITDACRSITVAGPAASLGHAEVVATDKASDLALLRVYGGGEWSPLPLGDGTPANATLIGVADPQLQGGGRDVSTVTAQLAATRSVEPTPALGFSGAAALDGEARLVGVVALRQADIAVPVRAALTPAAAVKAFLYTHALAPPSGRSGAEAAKAAIVQVICVRR
jgi:S1-C subfamily serine protease